MAAPRSLAAIDRGSLVPALPFEWASDLKADLEQNSLIKGILPAESLAVVHGHPGSGKTFLVLDMAMHIALGWPWNGCKVECGLVAYVAAEGGRGVKRRVKVWLNHHSVTSKPPFALLPEPISLFGDGNDIDALIRSILELSAECRHPPKLVVIDTLSKTFAGRENTDELAIYVANCQRIVTQTGATVLIVHHRPKDSESSDPRGHSSLKGGVDAVLLVEATSPKRVTVVKMKDGEEGERAHFDLKSVEIGVDAEGDPVTSCIVDIVSHEALPIDPMARTIAKLGSKQALALKLIGDCMINDGIPVPSEIPDTEINRMRVGKVAPFGQVADRLLSGLRTSPDEQPDTIRRNRSRCIETLKTKDLVGVWGDYLWLKH